MNECRIIEDLLPLYTDGLLQKDTNEYVKLHLVQCAACSAKEKQLKAAVPPPPDPPSREKKARFRRVGRKVRLKAFLLSGACLVVVVGIFLATYLPYYFNEVEMRFRIDEKSVILGQIKTTLSNARVNFGGEWVIPSKKGEGVRVKNDDLALYLPDESFIRIDDGHFARQEYISFYNYMSITDRIIFQAEENSIMWDSFARCAPAKIEGAYSFINDSYTKGENLLREVGRERRMELAYYFMDFPWDSLTEESSEESLALGYFIAKSMIVYCNFGTIYRISGNVSGYCEVRQHSWCVFLEDPYHEERCYHIDLYDESVDGLNRDPWDCTDEIVWDLLAGVEFL